MRSDLTILLGGNIVEGQGTEKRKQLPDPFQLVFWRLAMVGASEQLRANYRAGGQGVQIPRGEPLRERLARAAPQMHHADVRVQEVRHSSLKGGTGSIMPSSSTLKSGILPAVRLKISHQTSRDMPLINPALAA